LLQFFVVRLCSSRVALRSRLCLCCSALEALSPALPQLEALRADAEQKARLAAAAKAVVQAAQVAQREARLLTPQEIAAIKCVPCLF
jgi:hypothetical protein